MRRPAAILVVLTLLFAGACGDDSTDAEDPVGSGEDTTAPSSGGDATSEDALHDKLLTVDDLPEGWTVDPSADDDSGDDDSDSSEDDDETTPDCLKAAEGDDSSTASADADFIKGEDFPSLSESLDVYPHDTIEDELATVIDVLDTCGDFHFTSDEVEISGSITRVASFPKFGDESAAWRMQMSAYGVAFDFAIVFVRQGDIALSVFYGDQGTDAVQQVQPLVQLALAKV